MFMFVKKQDPIKVEKTKSQRKRIKRGEREQQRICWHVVGLWVWMSLSGIEQ